MFIDCVLHILGSIYVARNESDKGQNKYDESLFSEILPRTQQINQRKRAIRALIITQSKHSVRVKRMGISARYAPNIYIYISFYFVTMIFFLLFQISFY